jgi:DNA polymerase III gamma/tau subunit
MLSTSAFNALLLTLEEPPSHVVFILATTNIESVPITILSRCQRLDFKKISDEDIINRLKDVAKSEKIKITDEAIQEIAYISDGGLRDALSILDQLSKKNCEITDAIVLDTIGIISNKNINELVNNLENSDIDKIIEFVNTAKSLAVDYKSLIRKLIDKIKEQCILIKKNQINSNVGYSKYKQLCFELANTIYKSNVSIDSFSMLELILLEYTNSNDQVSEMVVEKKIVKHQKEVSEEKKESKSEEKVTKNDEKYFPGNIFELIDIRVNNCFAGAKKTKLTENKPKWQDFINNNTSKTTKGILMDTDIVLSSDGIMVIKTDLEENAQLINDKLSEISEDFRKYSKLDYLFIAVYDEYWKSKTEEYKENKDKGIKYKILEEPKIETQSKILDDVFSINKVEIK